MTEPRNGVMERLSNARRMLLKYQHMRDTNSYYGAETPVVVAHEIKNWQIQVDILDCMTMEQAA